MKENTAIKTKDGNIFMVNKVEKLGEKNEEYMLLFEVLTGEFVVGQNKNGVLEFVNDKKIIDYFNDMINKEVEKLESEENGNK